MKQVSEGILSTFSGGNDGIWGSLIPAGSSLPAHLPSHSITACAEPCSTGQGAAPCTLLPSYHCQLWLYCYSPVYYFTECEQVWFCYHIGKLDKEKKIHLKVKGERKSIILIIKKDIIYLL